jgi:D-serine deaminase-like pyridoxal phosphate-dependent protein
MTSPLSELETPALLLDCAKLDRNLARMQAQVTGARLRPHVKTSKSVEVVRRAVAPAGRVNSGGITVSTLKEAEHFFAAGYADILYAVGIAPNKLDHVAVLRARGCDLTMILDSVEAARAVAAKSLAMGAAFPVLIEIDSDGHRAGVKPGDARLLEIGRALGKNLRGVMTHAGGSYDCQSVAEIRAMAERERAAVVRCADELRAAGLPCDIVSVGSSPTATYAESFAGVTEVRAGVYMFFDLFMAGISVCAVDDIALSVLTSVIGHQPGKGWIITDAGWMALSRDRGTAGQKVDQGYGLVCDVAGKPLDGLIVSGANQEHGIVSARDGERLDGARMAQFPIGTLLRILPNHACATAAQHDGYHVVNAAQEIEARWPRFSGW